MKDTDWVLGDMVWAIVAAVVILGLMVLNAYVQRVVRIEEEEEQRIGLLGSDPLNRQRSAASQSRRPDDI
jgi:mannose/fructose/N-acetylgalactosamine-specific phosphotransferase system component IID